MNSEPGPIKLTRKDFASGQDVRWCPGCGDNAILAQMQKTLPELGIPRENIVMISGIVSETFGSWLAGRTPSCCKSSMLDSIMSLAKVRGEIPSSWALLIILSSTSV